MKSGLDRSGSELRREHPLGRDSNAHARKDSLPYSLGGANPETTTKRYGDLFRVLLKRPIGSSPSLRVDYRLMSNKVSRRHWPTEFSKIGRRGDDKTRALRQSSRDQRGLHKTAEPQGYVDTFFYEVDLPVSEENFDVERRMSLEQKR